MRKKSGTVRHVCINNLKNTGMNTITDFPPRTKRTKDEQWQNDSKSVEERSKENSSGSVKFPNG